MKKTVLVITLALTTFGIFSQNTIVNYLADNSLFANPERGFYHHTETHSTGYSALNSTTLQGFRTSENITLILRVFYLENFKTTTISNTYLNQIQQDLNAVRIAGLKCILRFAYTDSQGPADASKSIILQQLDQLKPIFENNADVIAVVQAGFIGSWGEWYYTTQSEFGIPPAAPNYTNRGQVVAKINSVLPKSRMVQLRTPTFKRNIFGITTPLPLVQAHTGTDIARSGHHNDCFLASADDYGTYNNVTTDKNYLSQECLYMPNGGETCSPSSYSGCANALSDMAYLRYSYLNTDYNGTVLSGWTSGGCMNEVKQKLGYRLKLVKGLFSDPVTSGNSFHVNLKLFNEGWAAPYNPRGVEIILRSVATPSQKFIFTLPDDPRFWLPGDTAIIDRFITIPGNVPVGTYDILLNLPDTTSSLKSRPEYAIRLANQNVWEVSTGYNKLLTTVTINNSAGTTVTPASSNICAGSSTTLTADGANSYTWSPATGLSSTSGATVTAAPTSTTTYTVTGVTGGSTTTASAIVIVNSIPAQPVISINGCNQLSSSSASGNRWYLNGNLISGAVSQNYFPSQSGNYTVDVLSGGCNSVQSQIYSYTLTAFSETSACTSGITIDGILNESVWSGTSQNLCKTFQGTGTEATASFRTRWDNQYLYIGVDVTDAILNNSAPAIWDNSGVELFLDMNNGKTPAYESNDFQYIVGWNNNTLYELSNRTTGVIFKTLNKTGGYILEIAIPFTTLGVTAGTGSIYGFDLAVNTSHTPGVRTDGIIWSGDINNSMNTSKFGTLTTNCLSTSILNWTSENTFSIYPNPNNGTMQLKYELNNHQKAEFNIYDVTGRKVGNYILQEGKNTLQINETGLQNGIYYHSVIVDGKVTKSDKLIIIR